VEPGLAWESPLSCWEEHQRRWGQRRHEKDREDRNNPNRGGGRCTTTFVCKDTLTFPGNTDLRDGRSSSRTLEPPCSLDLSGSGCPAWGALTDHPPGLDPTLASDERGSTPGRGRRKELNRGPASGWRELFKSELLLGML